MRTLKKDRVFSKTDLAALLIGAGLFCVFLYAARFGVGASDESYYLTVPQRLLAGDRMFVDEWHLTQTGYLFNVLPFYIYTKLAGGTEGVVLFFRCFYACIAVSFYGYMYYKLRGYRLWGLAASGVFYVLISDAITGFNYHSVANIAVMQVLLILFFSERRPGAGRLLLAGVIFACGVLAQPFLVFLFIVYAAAVGIRAVFGKKALPESVGYALTWRTLLCVGAGAFIMFLLFVAYLWNTGVFAALQGVLPHLLSGKEYSAAGFLDLSKFGEAIRVYGWVNIIGLAVCFVSAAVYRKSAEKRDLPKAKVLVFSAACVFLAASYVTALVNAFTHELDADLYLTLVSHELPALLFAPVPYLLSRERDPVQGAVWVTGAVFSLFADIASRYRIVLGGRVAQTAGVLALAAFVKELREDLRQKPKKKERRAQRTRLTLQRTAAVCLALGTVAFSAWTAVYALAESRMEFVEYLAEELHLTPLPETLSSGPLKGLHTTATVRNCYENALADLDRVREISGDAPVAVIGWLPYMYLCLDGAYGTFSACYQYEPERYIEYWRTLPERLPAVVYIPYFEYYCREAPDLEAQLRRFTGCFSDCTVAEGAGGYIITVTGSLL